MEQLPQTRLGRLQQVRTVDEMFKYCDDYYPDQNEFKFQRGPRNFDCVINFLRTGLLHLGEETCVIAFQQASKLQNFSYTVKDSFDYILRIVHKEAIAFEGAKALT